MTDTPTISAEDAFWSSPDGVVDEVVPTGEVATEEVVVDEAPAIEEVVVDEAPPVVDDLSAREDQMQHAREELAAEAAEARANQPPPPRHINVKSLNNLMSGIDLNKVRVPHPVEKGKTMSMIEARKEFPGAADYTNNMVAAVYQTQQAEMKALRTEMADMAKLNTVYRAHPDADDVVTSSEFEGWMKNQSENVNSLFDLGTGNDMNLVISRYKKTLVPDPVVTQKSPVGLTAPGQRADAAPARVNSQLFMSEAEIDKFWATGEG